jgi:hypothetical protein
MKQKRLELEADMLREQLQQLNDDLRIKTDSLFQSQREKNSEVSALFLLLL